MIFVQGTIRLGSPDIQDIAPAIKMMTTKSSEESGCIHYSFAQDVTDPRLLHICERWKSEEDLNAHFQTEHMAKFNALVATIEIAQIDVRMYAGDEVKVMMQS
ncbi:putative quinol monooxygenase [Parasphingorhabdus sp.]|uniref:putative quinol monooxygenase n=1 Tax=Parasphingorhabdus sp. TaxID=2709688 RepID=UPI003266F0B0